MIIFLFLVIGKSINFIVLQELFQLIHPVMNLLVSGWSLYTHIVSKYLFQYIIHKSAYFLHNVYCGPVFADPEHVGLKPPDHHWVCW